MVMVAEGDPELVGDRPFLDPADEDIDFFFLQKGGEFQRVGIVDDDGALDR